ncbi:hypothetical protein G6F56_007592 [Rhizopus delemar]|nr:hypothetical protein G6F56_007592 [Rhizopus delemar]
MLSQRKRNISLVAALSVNGVQFCATNNTTHGTNRAVFADYMTGLFNYLELEEPPDQTLIMDNCRIHLSSEVKQVIGEHLDDTDTLLRKIREGLADISANYYAG